MNKKQRTGMKIFTTIVLSIVLIFTTITPAFAKTKEPTLNVTNKTILVGKSIDLNVKNKIANATYEWTSSKEKVATVDKNGVVTGSSKGEAIIHCKIKLSNKVYRLQAKIKVLKPAIKVTINNKIENIKVGESYNLNSSILPASSNDEVTWTSSDEKIASPQFNGYFKALKEGTVTITCTSVSGRSDSVTIIVSNEDKGAKTSPVAEGGKANE